MLAVLRSDDDLGDALDGAVVVGVHPGGLVEHDFGDILDLTSEDEIPLDTDDVACCGDVDELIGAAPGNDLAPVVLEDELVVEDVRGELDSGFEDERHASRCETPVALVVDEIVVQDVEPQAEGHTVEVVHEPGDIIVWNGC